MVLQAQRVKKVFATISRFVGFDLIAAAGLFPAGWSLFVFNSFGNPPVTPLSRRGRFGAVFASGRPSVTPSNANDFIFQKQGGNQTLVAVEEGGGSYRASLIIGIEPTRS